MDSEYVGTVGRACLVIVPRTRTTLRLDPSRSAAKGQRRNSVRMFFVALVMLPCRKERIASHARCSAMFAEKRCQASRLVSGEALAARGNFSHDRRNCRTHCETRSAAYDVPCPETGVERRQIITGSSSAMIG